jgi:hypothetical protein
MASMGEGQADRILELAEEGFALLAGAAAASPTRSSAAPCATAAKPR